MKQCFSFKQVFIIKKINLEPCIRQRSHFNHNVEPYFKAGMILFKHSKDLRSYLSGIKGKNGISGFVPTMGALHEGHLSLIGQSRLQTDITICSIFVNPIQFNNTTDFEKYPSNVEKDILLLEETECDILFMPA